MLNTRAKERYTKHVFSLPGLRHQFKPYRWYFKLQCSQAVLCLLIINISLQLNTPYRFSPLDFGGTKSHHLHQHGDLIHTVKIHGEVKQRKLSPKSYGLHKQERRARGYAEGKNICKSTHREENQEQHPGLPNPRSNPCSHVHTNAQV